MKKRILLINPAVHDFKAFNLWARPLGLLYLSSFLKQSGFDTDFIDCLDARHEGLCIDKNYKKGVKRRYSTYQYFREELEKPEQYKNIKRRYFRFGVNPEILKELILKLVKPDLVLITGIMTYWYPGVFEAIRAVKEIYPGVKVMLGGIYASLCTSHALKYSGADIIANDNNLESIFVKICSLLENTEQLKYFKKKNNKPVIFSLYPDYDNYTENNFIPLLTSLGCPFTCRYCASGYLQSSFIERRNEDIISEILYWKSKFRITDIAFYDDALLYDREKRIKPLLKSIIALDLGINFHSPNGMNLRYIDQELAHLMKKSGFKTLRFGFESQSERTQNESGGKITNKEYENGLNCLFIAGFKKENIGIYILIGIPGENPADAALSISYVKSSGAQPKLCEYTPIPHTEYFSLSKEYALQNIEEEPLYQNNTALSVWHPEYTDEIIEELKTSRGL